ncbi:c-type cytochrome [Corallococcus macrosporus]|uniref:Cytochrome c n=1 Tax=Corallococcus macrosporus DSM 14697 TaxID=1189310 RepID=A0A250JRY5_9BACT|nr:c-type cytochrome [Corallococcus macrosporus]ATB46141.1 cytochrome c [Corallococcus macrosporus DSM 14697]
MRSSLLFLLLALSACQRNESPPPAKAPAAAAPAPSTPKAPPAAVAVDAAKLERGRYLVENVLACGSCHTPRDWSRYGGPASGPALSGACWDDASWELPGRVCAPNITPDPEHGIGRWTDAELLRALRDGTGRDGKTLFPLMPFLLYRELSDADAHAVIAWLRQAPASPRDGGRSAIPDEVYAQYKDLAAPVKTVVPEPAADDVSRGRYLATVAQCAACHAGMDDAGTPFAGGRPLPTPHGPEVVANLTPHARGLGALDEAAFVARFTAFKDLTPAPAKAGQVNKLTMPWVFFAGLAEADLRALYRYLRTVPAMAPTAPSASGK